MLTQRDWEKLSFPPVDRSGGAILTAERPKRLVLYGAGYGGLMLAELLGRQGLAPDCLLDADPQKEGRVLMGTPVRAPSRKAVEGAVVVICLLRTDGIYRRIRAQMEAWGAKRVLHLYELGEDRALFQNQRLILSPDRTLLWEHRGALYEVYRLLEDGPSRRTITAIVRALWAGLGEEVPALPMEEQYFAYDLFQARGDEVFVDCGAHVGEILEQFLRRNGRNFCEYWAFEPDPENMRRLQAASPPELEGRIRLCPVALGEGEGTVRVRNYDGSNSVLCEDGEVSAPCLPLDRYGDRLHPTHLKIDVEGWEARLLAGGEEMIRRARPVISIAVYHRERDFWELPLLLKRWVPEYRLYLRSYLNVAETVLYAVPPERLVERGECP